MQENTVFSVLNALNCNEHVEKKGNLSYLSWAWAWQMVKSHFPDASYTIYESPDGWNNFTDGINFSQMRICHMYAGADAIRFGVYACSPEESSFTAVFSDMKITECMWKAHDGQQPDE